VTTPPVSLFVNASSVPWVERRPGVFWKTLWEDSDGRHKAILMRYEPGAVIPRHRHVGDEQIYVL
jgi:anti-sigma factor ChrR (cupin superfamily)